MKFIRGLLVFIGILAILLAGFVGLSVYGYGQLQTDFEATNVGVKTNLTASSFFSALLSALTLDYAGAVFSIIEGLEVQGGIVYSNPTFLPLYIPEMEHSISINGVSTASSSTTPAFWLAPKAEVTQPFAVLIYTEDLPEVVLSTIANGGDIAIEVSSEVFLGPFSWTKSSTSSQKPSIGGQGTGSAPQFTAPSISSGWYVGSTSVTSVNKGTAVTASISLSGGTAGSYTLEVRRDIDLSTDQTVQTLAFDYSGSNATKTVSFVASYATGESGNNGYHLDLLFGTNTVWTMTDAYPPRLKVNPTQTTPTSQPPPLAVTSYRFTPSSVKLGASSTLSVTLTAGNSGTYTISFIKDVPLGTDQLVSQYTFQHNGASSSISTTFTPISVGTYHVNITYSGQTIWSQPNDLTRLQVTASSSLLAITQYVFNPVSIKQGNTTRLTFTITGGTAGTYTIRFIKDIDFLPDQEITYYAFQYDGSSITLNLQFTPPSTGSYHVDLSLGGQTVWRQPNDSSRLKVTN